MHTYPYPADYREELEQQIDELEEKRQVLIGNISHLQKRLQQDRAELDRTTDKRNVLLAELVEIEKGDRDETA